MNRAQRNERLDLVARNSGRANRLELPPTVVLNAMSDAVVSHHENESIFVEASLIMHSNAYLNNSRINRRIDRSDLDRPNSHLNRPIAVAVTSNITRATD